MANFVNYDNAYDILSALSSKPGMKYKSIDCGTTSLGTAITNVLLPAASSIAWIHIPVLRIRVPVGGYISINVGGDGAPGPQFFHKVSGTEAISPSIDNKWVGVRIFNTSATTLTKQPYIKISGGIYTLSAAGFLSIVNSPKVELIIPTANGTDTTAGAKIVTPDGEYFYGTESSVTAAFYNYKIFDISDIVSNVTTDEATAGESYDDNISNFARYSGGTWTIKLFGVNSGSRKAYLGRVVDEFVKRYMMIKGIPAAYVSNFIIDFDTECGTTSLTPTSVVMGARYVGVCYK